MANIDTTARIFAVWGIYLSDHVDGDHFMLTVKERDDNKTSVGEVMRLPKSMHTHTHTHTHTLQPVQAYVCNVKHY